MDNDPTPLWKITQQRERRKFILYSAVVFGMCALLAFWILPRFAATTRELLASSKIQTPAWLNFMLGLADWFRVLWFFIAVGLGTMSFFAWRGWLDSFLTVLNLVMLLAGLAAFALAMFAFYGPARLLIDANVPT